MSPLPLRESQGEGSRIQHPESTEPVEGPRFPLQGAIGAQVGERVKPAPDSPVRELLVVARFAPVRILSKWAFAIDGLTPDL